MCSSRQDNPLLEVIGRWLLGQKKQMRQMAALTAEDVMVMAMTRFDEIRRSTDKRQAAMDAPDKIFEDVIGRFPSANEEQQNHCIAVVCQVLITCLTMCNDLDLRDAAEEVTFRAREYNDLRQTMESLMGCMDQKIVRVAQWVQEIEEKGEWRVMSEKRRTMSEERRGLTTIINNFAQGAVENYGQMNVGSGTINIKKDGREED